MFAQANNEENIQAQVQCFFVRGIHRSLHGLLCYQSITASCILHNFVYRWTYIRTNLFMTALINIDMTMLRKHIPPMWRYVRDMASQITGSSTVVFFNQQKWHQSSALLSLCDGNPPVTYYYCYFIIIIIIIIIVVIISLLLSLWLLSSLVIL